MAKEETKVTTVEMDDGRVVDFPGKRKLQKNSVIGADGSVIVHLDWVNGEFRSFVLPPSLIGRFAAHGAEQKLGDQIAGLKGKDGGEADIDDCVFAVDELIDRLNAGEWTLVAAGNGMAGTSVLAQALVKVYGKTMEQIKAYLKPKSQAEKIALRNSPKIKPVVEELEAAKAAKAAAAGKTIDTAALEAELDAIGG